MNDDVKVLRELDLHEVRARTMQAIEAGANRDDIIPLMNDVRKVFDRAASVSTFIALKERQAVKLENVMDALTAIEHALGVFADEATPSNIGLSEGERFALAAKDIASRALRSLGGE